MISLLYYYLWTFTPLTHGCPAAGANVSNTLGERHFLDAGVCPHADLLTLPIFGAFVIVGLVNLPIYIRQDSVLTPFVVTTIIGGVVLTQVAGILQTLIVVLVLFVVGLGPVLVLRRVQQS